LAIPSLPRPKNPFQEPVSRTRFKNRPAIRCIGTASGLVEK
jgi:hypothetical protein